MYTLDAETLAHIERQRRAIAALTPDQRQRLVRVLRLWLVTVGSAQRTARLARRLNQIGRSLDDIDKDLADIRAMRRDARVVADTAAAFADILDGERPPGLLRDILAQEDEREAA